MTAARDVQPRVCASCGHQLSSSNREAICRVCQAKEFGQRVNNPAPLVKGTPPRGSGPLTLARLRRSEVQSRRSIEGRTRRPKDRRCVCGEPPHLGPCAKTLSGRLDTWDRQSRECA